jgi:hypothetical protein
MDVGAGRDVRARILFFPQAPMAAAHPSAQNLLRIGAGHASRKDTGIAAGGLAETLASLGVHRPVY